MIFLLRDALFLRWVSAVGAFCKTPGYRLSALVEPFGAHGGRFAKRPYSSNAAVFIEPTLI